MPVIEARATVIILAGSETTAVALTAAIHHILSNRDIYDKLCDDIYRKFTNLSEIILPGRNIKAAVSGYCYIRNPTDQPAYYQWFLKSDPT